MAYGSRLTVSQCENGHVCPLGKAVYSLPYESVVAMTLSKLRLFLPALAAIGLAACGNNSSPEAPAPFITVKRHWQPGERAARIQSIIQNREFNFLYVGDISDLAPQIYADTDSVIV